MAEAVAQPLLGTRRVTVVAGGSGDIGVGRLPAEILGVVTKLPSAVEALTGVSIAQVRRLGGAVGLGVTAQLRLSPSAPLRPHRRRSRSRTAWPELMLPNSPLNVPHKCQRPTVPLCPPSATTPPVSQVPPDRSAVAPPPPPSATTPQHLHIPLCHCAPQVPPPHVSPPPKCLQTAPLGRCDPQVPPPPSIALSKPGITPPPSPPPQGMMGDVCVSVCPHVCTSPPRLLKLHCVTLWCHLGTPQGWGGGDGEGWG